MFFSELKKMHVAKMQKLFLNYKYFVKQLVTQCNDIINPVASLPVKLQVRVHFYVWIMLAQPWGKITEYQDRVRLITIKNENVFGNRQTRCSKIVAPQILVLFIIISTRKGLSIWYELSSISISFFNIKKTYLSK